MKIIAIILVLLILWCAIALAHQINTEPGPHIALTTWGRT